MTAYYLAATRGNLMTTSSATTEVSFHPPEPTSNWVRLMGNEPSKVCGVPWLVTLTGTVTFCDLPLMVNLPLTLNFVPPAGAIAVDTKVAVGKCAVSNQSLSVACLL